MTTSPVWEGAGWYGLDGRYAAECTSDLVSGHPFERAVAESFLGREGVEGLADLLRLRADLGAFMDEEVDALAVGNGGIVEDDDGNPWFWWDDVAEFRIWVAEGLGQEAM